MFLSPLSLLGGWRFFFSIWELHCIACTGRDETQEAPGVNDWDSEGVEKVGVLLFDLFLSLSVHVWSRSSMPCDT